jgi:hypothetical protein
MWSSWRLDAESGDLEFCTYTTDLAPPAPNVAPLPDQMTCSTPAKGPSSD